MYKLIILLLIFASCNTGKLNIIADLPNNLKEVSATEITPNSDLIWVIEDGGNKNNLYAINSKGKIIKDIDVENADNEDWEDLTSDNQNNLYIGDFGNNSKNRSEFLIYKINNPLNATDAVSAEKISFTLPKKMDSEDFEAFFIYDNTFYIFSKGNKNGVLIKVPNTIGNHIAEIVTEFNLDGKDDPITSADISDDGTTVVLLNHEKVWKLTGFTSANFFSGTITKQSFEHKSQKEGICFKSGNTVLITDEKNKHDGNLYSYKTKRKSRAILTYKIVKCP
jgi:hypothetical protein